jgi:hypothetical protein
MNNLNIQKSMIIRILQNKLCCIIFLVFKNLQSFYKGIYYLYIPLVNVYILKIVLCLEDIVSHDSVSSKDKKSYEPRSKVYVQRRR